MQKNNPDLGSGNIRYLNIQISKSISEQIPVTFLMCSVTTLTGAHSANFDEKVHKPQSKSYGRIGANMQLIFTHIL